MLAKLSLLALVPAAMGHTWIEQMRNINADGLYVGEYGYSRGFKDKAEPGYDSEKDMNYLLPPLEQQPPFITADNLLCNPNQRKPEQSSEKYPRLQSTPGGWIALRYSENGHVSNPADEKGRREKGGSVFVFGTTEPKEEEKIVDVLRWTQDGQGGDKRGVLLAVNNFDDGRCYEINPKTQNGRMKEFPNYAQGAPQEGPGAFPLMCETNVQLPETAETGKPYTLYWVWQWPVDANGPIEIYPDGKDQYYTTCMDVDVAESVQQTASAQFGLAQQDGQEHAVKDFRNRKAIVTDPIEGNVGPLFREGGDDNSGEPSSSELAPTGSATATPSQTTFATVTTAPFLNSTMTATSALETPTPSASSSPISDDGAVRITVTTRITVTATPEPSATTTDSAMTTATATPTTSSEPELSTPQKRAEHAPRPRVWKIRGMSYRD